MNSDNRPRPVGERFYMWDERSQTYQTYRVALPSSEEGSCRECAFYRRSCCRIHVSGSCLPEERPDHRQVVFVKCRKRETG